MPNAAATHEQRRDECSFKDSVPSEAQLPFGFGFYSGSAPTQAAIDRQTHGLQLTDTLACRNLSGAHEATVLSPGTLGPWQGREALRGGIRWDAYGGRLT